jgi:hypothetical protein
MSAARYSFDLLFRHSNQLATTTRQTLKHPLGQSRRLFAFLSNHFAALEREPRSLVRNVKLALTARFTNHMFSQLLLIERGLLLDAFNCSRASLEATAFYWLVCKDPTTAELYDGERSPKPVDVRRRLEQLGVDVSALRELYSFQSEIAHVGNKTDGLQISWDSVKDGRLLVGGGLEPVVQRAMLVGMVKSVFRFVKFDGDYIVPDLDKELPDF